MKLTVLILACFSSLIGFAQTVRYVKPVASGAGDGSSWANASNELQNIIDASVAGDQVWVAQGVYFPTEYATGCTNCTTSRNYTFSLKSGVEVYGGFQGTEAALGERQMALFPTILDGDLDQDGILNTGNVYSVVTALNTDAASRLDGFQIRNGYSNGGSSTSAGTPAQSIITSASGGIYCWNAASIITNCKISNCWGYSGGGLYSRNSTLQITDCLFEANLNGGGMAVVTSTTLINRCHFINNQAGNYGGGIYNDSPNSIITNCVFAGNSAIRGGALSNYSGNSLVLANCIFAGNSASAEGGAIHNTFFFGADAVNCTFYNNTSPLGSLMWNWSSSGSVVNSIVNGHVAGSLTGFSNGGNVPTITYSLLEEVFVGTGNVVGDPLFVSTVDWDGPDNVYKTADDGLIPFAGSPAIDMGNNAAIPPGITIDITGSSRIIGGVVNAGAYEVAGCLPPTAPVNTTVAELTCPGGTTTLTASGSGTLGWYSAASGGVFLGGGTSFTTPSLSSTTTFYVQDSTCAAGPRTAIVAQVGDTIDPGITLPSDTILYVSNGACEVIFNYTVSTSDNCGLPSISQSAGLGSGGSFPIGVTQNSYEVTDVAGNVVSASFTVTVVNQNASSQSVTICSGETFSIGSSTYGTAGTYTDTLQSWGGCDSVVTTQLTVLPHVTFSQQLTLCAGESLTVGSSTYSISGSYSDTLQAMNGCDSIVATQLTILPVVTFSQQLTVCEGESVTVGNSEYSVSGTYTDTLQAINGCDSLVMTELTVLTIPVATAVYQNGILSIPTVGDAYQWISCTSFLPVPGGNATTLTPTQLDWYAVIVTVGGTCSDTSECVFVDDLSVLENNPSGWLTQVAPNPVSDVLTVYSSEEAFVSVTDLNGLTVLIPGSISEVQTIDVSMLAPGMYFLRFDLPGKQRMIRIVKE